MATGSSTTTSSFEEPSTPLPVEAAPSTPTVTPDPVVVPPVPWQPGADSGLTGPIAAVLEDAPATGPVRVVTITQDGQGRPRIDVATAADKDEAVAAVEEGRATPGALAVGVDQPVGIASVDEPVVVAVATDTRPAAAAAAAAPAQINDTYRQDMWALDTLQAETAWQWQTGGGQVIAVIDTGVDGLHPDLIGRVLPGLDIVSPGDGRIDPHGHGTHVAGTIAAVADNNQGVAGLAPSARILPVRVLDEFGRGWSSDIARGIIWAVDHGATVLNLSLGGREADAASASAVSYAQDKNVVVVAAAGNERSAGSPPSYPAAYPGVVAVAATDINDASASFSNIGSYVTVAAPGAGIVSTYPATLGSYASLSGTSMASPHAAATLALMRSMAPNMSAAGVISVLVATTRDLGPAGRDDEFGSGLIAPVAALQALGADMRAALPGSTFQALDPTRVLDTRDGTGAPKARVEAGGTVTLQVTGQPGVPASGVTAVVMNVTAVAPSSNSYVTAYPFGQPRPLASNLNTSANAIVPNLVVVKVGTDGKIVLYNHTGSTDLIADLAGYYTSDAPGSTFQALDPTRVLDTRDGTGAPKARVEAGGTVTLQVTGQPGVPASGVTAVVMNVTAVAPSSNSYVTAYPFGQPRPLASNLNTSANAIVPNLVVVKVGTDGKVILYNHTGSTDLIADLAGYYAS